MQELIFTDAPAISSDGRLNGPCCLPTSIEWPLDSDGNPLFHLASVPLKWFRAVPQAEDDKLLWISIFVSYDPVGFSHYSKMSSNHIDHDESAVIVHDMSGPSIRRNPNQSDISKAISISEAMDSDENVASHIGFEPAWVQDPINIDGFSWVMSIYGPDMDGSLGKNAGIFSDGVGYLFLKDKLELQEFGSAGKFFLQI